MLGTWGLLASSCPVSTQQAAPINWVMDEHVSVYTTRGLISSSIAASEPYHRRVCFLPIAGGIVQRVIEGVFARVALELGCAPELQYLVGAIPVR